MGGHEGATVKHGSAPVRIGRYEIIGPLAAGGMAEILLARLAGAHGFERVVALKRVLPHLARDESFVRMFIDEARIVSELRHPNVVQVLELGQHDGELFMAMEYLEGEPLSGLLRRMRIRKTSLPRALAAYVVAESAAGLHAAHELKSPDGTSRELVHRDVSPQNIFITYDGQVKVIDFGIAKAADRVTRTQTGQLKGKQAYMSPEQTHLGPLDRRSDVFSLGVVLWEVSVGRRLFDRGTLLDTLQAIRSCDVPAPSSLVASYPPGLEGIVMETLAEHPAARPATALALRSKLLEEARTLGLSPDPRDALGTFMREHFEDRIAVKAAMIRSVRDGVNVPVVAPAEVDLSAELSPVDSHVRDTASFEAARRGVSATTARVPELHGPAPWHRSVWLRVGVGLLVAVGAFATLLLVLTDESGEASPEAGSLPNAAVLPADAVPAPNPSSAAPGAPDDIDLLAVPDPGPGAVAIVGETVAVDVVTTPEGAEVLVDGEVQGLTPVTLDLTRSSGAVAIELRRDGYVDETETVDTDRDVRLRVTLRRAPRAPTKRRRAVRMRNRPSPAMSSDPPPFGRLD